MIKHKIYNDNYIIKIKALLLAIMLIISNGTVASESKEEQSHVYLGGQVGVSHFLGACSSNAIECKNYVTGGGLYGGYQFNSWFALEGSWHDYGSPKTFYGVGDGYYSNATGVDLSVKLSLPVTDNLDLYAKGGAAYNYLSVSGNDNVHLGMFESDSSLDDIWEIGAEYALAPNWSLRLGTSVIDGIGNAKTGKSDLYFTSLGLTYKFKAKPEPKPETIVKLVPEATYYPEQVTLHFEFGESRFVVESKQWHSWNELALSVKQGQGKVSITGYTDAKGTDSANDIESLRRATYAADMLIKAGVDEERILINSKGSADPLVNEDLMRNESALNRRVVIQFNRRVGS